MTVTLENGETRTLGVGSSTAGLHIMEITFGMGEFKSEQDFDWLKAVMMFRMPSPEKQYE